MDNQANPILFSFFQTQWSTSLAGIAYCISTEVGIMLIYELNNLDFLMLYFNPCAQQLFFLLKKTQKNEKQPKYILLKYDIQYHFAKDLKHDFSCVSDVSYNVYFSCQINRLLGHFKNYLFYWSCLFGFFNLDHIRNLHSATTYVLLFSLWDSELLKFSFPAIYLPPFLFTEISHFAHVFLQNI